MTCSSLLSIACFASCKFLSIFFIEFLNDIVYFSVSVIPDVSFSSFSSIKVSFFFGSSSMSSSSSFRNSPSNLVAYAFFSDAWGLISIFFSAYFGLFSDFFATAIGLDVFKRGAFSGTFAAIGAGGELVGGVWIIGLAGLPIFDASRFCKVARSRDWAACKGVKTGWVISGMIGVYAKLF